MNIGILSMQKVINYGSVLQAYSLQKILFDCGIDNLNFIDIDWTGEILTNMPVPDSADYAVPPYLDFSKVQYLMKKIINKEKKTLIKKHIEAFQRTELGISTQTEQQHFDLVFVGSDEVFMAKKRLSPQLYGNILNADHIVSYAASCGSTVYEGLPQDRISEIKQYLSHFELMSVRDKHTKEYISRLYDKDIELHLDPVLVGPLYKIKHSRKLEYPYLLIYAYGDRIRKKEEIVCIKQFAKSKHLKTVAIGAPQYWADRNIVCSPMDLLDYFYYSDFVVTDTFHGTVFSIINNCNFCIFARPSNAFKIIGLLDVLGLDNKIVSDASFMSKVLYNKIDYNAVNIILDKERERTKDYLNRAIHLVR